MSLFLSGGHPQQHDGTLGRFCEALIPSRKLMFIPHGIAQEHWLKAAREIKAQLAPYGISDFVLDADLRFSEVRPEDCSGVLIANGDLNRLHKHLLSDAGGYSFRPWLERAFQNRIPILAIGQAAVLMGKDLRTADAHLERSEHRSRGLNFLGGASVRNPALKAEKAQQRPSGRAFPMWQIPPDAGLELAQDGIHILGRSEVYCWLHDGQLSYPAGTYLRL